MAPSKFSAAAESKTSALLGVLIQHDNPARCAASISASNEDQGTAARYALKPQSRLSASKGPRAAQQQTSALIAPSIPAHASGHQSSTECPLCGCSVPVNRLEAHVQAEFQKLDEAAHRATHLQSAPTAQHARQAPHFTAAEPSRKVQATVELLPRQPQQAGGVGHVPSDHSSQGTGGALWPDKGISDQNTLYGISISGMLPAAQQATAAAATSRRMPASTPLSGQSCTTLHQKQRQVARSMQRSRSDAPAACGSATAQQGQRTHQALKSSGVQPHPRPQIQQKRQRQGLGQPGELCSRASVQQRPGAASHRQPPGKRRPQVYLC